MIIDHKEMTFFNKMHLDFGQIAFDDNFVEMKFKGNKTLKRNKFTYTLHIYGYDPTYTLRVNFKTVNFCSKSKQFEVNQSLKKSLHMTFSILSSNRFVSKPISTVMKSFRSGEMKNN